VGYPADADKASGSPRRDASPRRLYNCMCLSGRQCGLLERIGRVQRKGESASHQGRAEQDQSKRLEAQVALEAMCDQSICGAAMRDSIRRGRPLPTFALIA
jgi:hypothetical protein